MQVNQGCIHEHLPALLPLQVCIITKRCDALSRKAGAGIVKGGELGDTSPGRGRRALGEVTVTMARSREHLPRSVMPTEAGALALWVLSILGANG